MIYLASVLSFLLGAGVVVLIWARVLHKTFKPTLALQDARIEDLERALSEAYRKLEASMSANADIIRSRDDTWTLYHTSSLMAGNAQAWLMRELKKAIAELNKYREKEGKAPAAPSPELRDFVEKFKTDHVENTPR